MRKKTRWPERYDAHPCGHLCGKLRPRLAPHPIDFSGLQSTWVVGFEAQRVGGTTSTITWVRAHTNYARRSCRITEGVTPNPGAIWVHPKGHYCFMLDASRPV